MTQPDIDMVDRLVELIDNSWNDGPEDVPRNNLRIDTSDELGKGRDLGTYDYIEASNTSPIGIEYANAVVFLIMVAVLLIRPTGIAGEET